MCHIAPVGVDGPSRPTMRVVPVKSAEQQADLLLATERERLVRQRTQLTNMIRAEHQEVRAVSSSGSYT